jgi:hypothetical protein
MELKMFLHPSSPVLMACQHSEKSSSDEGGLLKQFIIDNIINNDLCSLNIIHLWFCQGKNK